MTRKILHTQSDDSTKNVQRQILRLSQQDPDQQLSPDETIAAAFGRETEHYLVLDRLAGSHANVQQRLANPDRPGIAWPSDELLSDRSAAIHLMQMVPVVFLTIAQALKFTGGNQPRAAVEWLRKRGVTNVIVSDGITCFGCFDECQELHPLPVRHHDDPQKRVEIFFGSLAWALANDLRWTEATRLAQAAAVIDVPFTIAKEEYSRVRSVALPKPRRSTTRIVATAISLLLGIGAASLFITSLA